MHRLNHNPESVFDRNRIIAEKGCDNNMFDFFVIGGDMRQAYLADILQRQGYQVSDFLLPQLRREEKPQGGSLLFELLQDSDLITQEKSQQIDFLARLSESFAVLAPIPLSKDGIILNSTKENTKISLDFIIEHLKEGQYFFAGCIPAWFIGKCEQKGVFCYDYMKDEPLAVRNAVATAEGVLAEAILKYPGNLHDTDCLVLGFGKCGRVLAEKLKGLSAKVTVCIRKDSDYAWAKACGYEAVYFDIKPTENKRGKMACSYKETKICCQSLMNSSICGYECTKKYLNCHISEFPLIFNTVPSLVLHRELLSELQKDAMIFDIASAPGGIDYEVSKRLGISANLYPSLPGKYAPKASAEVMVEAIKRIIRKE